MSLPNLHSHDALILVDVQNDFCPGGALPVPDGDAIVPVLNRWIEVAERGEATVVVTRDWHPADHVSFQKRGGPWPAHCVQETRGAEIRPELRVPQQHLLVSKGTERDRDCYSDFDHSKLAGRLRERGVTRLWIGGLALEVCVRATVLDGLADGFEVHLISAGTRAMEPQDAAATLQELAAAAATVENDPE
jgi:nicotinamidase/pyrazinamidase